MNKDEGFQWWAGCIETKVNCGETKMRKTGRRMSVHSLGVSLVTWLWIPGREGFCWSVESERNEDGWARREG